MYPTINNILLDPNKVYRLVKMDESFQKNDLMRFTRLIVDTERGSGRNWFYVEDHIGSMHFNKSQVDSIKKISYREVFQILGFLDRRLEEEVEILREVNLNKPRIEI